MVAMLVVGDEVEAMLVLAKELRQADLREGVVMGFEGVGLEDVLGGGADTGEVVGGVDTTTGVGSVAAAGVVDGGGTVIGVVEGEAVGPCTLAMASMRPRQANTLSHKCEAILLIENCLKEFMLIRETGR